MDQAGKHVGRSMIADPRAIDITVHPDQRLTDELIWGVLGILVSQAWAEFAEAIAMEGLGNPNRTFSQPSGCSAARIRA
jgi:hypothetical protein